MPHPECFVTSFCRKCNSFGHHVLYCDAPRRTDMPTGGFIKVRPPQSLKSQHGANFAFASNASRTTRIARTTNADLAATASDRTAPLNLFGLPVDTAMMDSGATCNLVIDAAHLEDVHPVRRGQNISGAAFGSTMRTTHSGTLQITPDISVKA